MSAAVALTAIVLLNAFGGPMPGHQADAALYNGDQEALETAMKQWELRREISKTHRFREEATPLIEELSALYAGDVGPVSGGMCLAYGLQEELFELNDPRAVPVFAKYQCTLSYGRHTIVGWFLVDNPYHSPPYLLDYVRPSNECADEPIKLLADIFYNSSVDKDAVRLIVIPKVEKLLESDWGTPKRRARAAADLERLKAVLVE